MVDNYFELDIKMAILGVDTVAVHVRTELSLCNCMMFLGNMDV